MNNKIVIRGADVGYTKAFDEGVFKGVDAGIISQVDVMLDGRHAKECLKWMKERPWISFGWHRHMWNKPVLNAEEVPDMVDENGNFKWGHKNGKLKNTVPYQQAYKEFEAELQMCYEITGRYPDCCSQENTDSEFEQAFKDVCNKYGVALNILKHRLFPLNPEYEHLHYNMRSIGPGKYKLAEAEAYNPLQQILDLKLEDNENYLISAHPGYLDDVIYRESSCSIHRVMELDAYLDIRLKQWIIDNKLVLVNQKDLMTGSNDFQQYLKEINSELWQGNFM